MTPTSYNGIVTNICLLSTQCRSNYQPSGLRARLLGLRRWNHNLQVPSTKCHHVVASLANSTAQRALSILASPPATEKYQAIKLFLTSTYELPDYERAAALFNMSGLGDYKPSQLMDNLFALLGEHNRVFFSNTCFYNNCPITSEPHWPHQRLQITDSSHKKPIKSMLLGIPSSSVQEVNSTDGEARPSPHVNSTRAGSIYQLIIDNMCWYHRRHNQRASKCVVSCKHHSYFYKNQGNLQQGQK